jgi:hypothetical protein
MSRIYSINDKNFSVKYDRYDHANNAAVYQVSCPDKSVFIPEISVSATGAVVMPAGYYNDMSRDEMLFAVKEFLKDEYREGGNILPPNPLIANDLEFETERPDESAKKPATIYYGSHEYSDDFQEDVLSQINDGMLRWETNCYTFTRSLSTDDDEEHVTLVSSRYFDPSTNEFCLHHSAYQGGRAPNSVVGVNTGLEIPLDPVTGGQFYEYHINLDERGSFLADVRDSETGQCVFLIKAGDELAEGETSIFEDGFMKHKSDVQGLEKYLIANGFIAPHAMISRGSSVTSSRGCKL